MDLDALLGLLFFVVFVVVPMITGARKRGQGRSRPPQGAPGQGQAQRGSPGQPATQAGQGGSAASGAQGAGTTQGASTAQRGEHPASATLEEIRRRVQEAQERERQRDAEGSTARRGSQASTAAQRSRGLVSSDPFEGRLVSGSARSITGEPMGREGTSSEWPPPPYDPLAGRPPTSVIGREGQQGQAQGQSMVRPSVLGREGGVPARPSGSSRVGPQASGSLGREGALPGPRPSVQRGRSAGGLGREGATGLGMMPSSSRTSLGREGGSPRKQRVTTREIGGSGAQPVVSRSGARLGRAGLVDVDREGILHGLIWHEILSEAPGKKLLRRTRSRPQ